jgi:AraC family transcriptional regulator of adaptative response/methylated-DNA-[protein]-cysteine methyltransferase
VKASQQKQARAAIILRDDRWKKLLARDVSSDGRFFYAVKTTGVYCRASCASRLPRPENIVFYTNVEGARRAGFRACKRCKPDESVGGTPRTERIAKAELSMSASTFGAGGKNNDVRFAIGKCSLGSILVSQSGRGICAILFGDDTDTLTQDLQDRFPKANLIGGDRNFERLVARVVRLVEAPAIGLDLPLDVRGTAFQQRVWQALRKVQPGKTASYTDIATRIGSPKAVRAVAQACAANALAVAIPCHRVVRNDGALAGYRWGIERKRALLQREARA